MNPHIYIDWSGDPGFRFRRGSSDLLLVAAVSTEENEIDLSSLREELALPADYEFHFAKTSAAIRKKFQQFVFSKLDFSRAIVLRVDKRLLPQEYRKMSGEQILAEFIVHCIKDIPDNLLQNAILLYDGKREQKSFRNVLRKTISDMLKPAVYLRDVKAMPASQNDGLQTADMLAGLVRTQSQMTSRVKLKIVRYPR
ncbi:MAG: hypothetical protein COS37_00275 [Anaerolineae bacterium CG03_land_8_20_14_0_80_58_20]|nr:MAG: hypothetical protein AUJ21_02085 [Anaerolineae bacterium CG1_02_58_13]PIV28747.1 MAG: hypothetical protein COS37_00275 [Anaerolineae bacterium CG03_land_8_20_14_0_80_58_20]